MGNKIFIILLIFFVLLNNYVNSQAIKCDINQPNSCYGINSFRGEIYKEEFICQRWDNQIDTICVPKSLIVECNSNEDCQEGYKCIFNQCHIPVENSRKFKRMPNLLEQDVFIFVLCVAIPLIFVGIVVVLVSYAKKAYDKAELKRAQNTNASSLSSMNLYSSKNYMYSRSTNNGSSNRSVVNFENQNNQMMDHYNFNSNINGFNNMNNINSNFNNYNSTPPFNAGGVIGHKATPSLGSAVSGGHDNYDMNNLDFNTQLFMAKNYRMQGYGTSSLQRNQSSGSQKYNTPPQFSLKEKNNSSSPQYHSDNLDGTTAAMSEVSTKDGSIKNISPMNIYSNHRSELPAVPVINKNNRDDDDKSSVTYYNQKYKNESEISNRSRNQNYYNYDKSYNDIKKDKRISVSPPLKDWNDSYITIQSDESSNTKTYSSSKDNKRKDYKNKEYHGKDSISQPKYPTPAYKSTDRTKHGTYNDYMMALNSKKSHAVDIIDQYADNEDITMKI